MPEFSSRIEPQPINGQPCGLLKHKKRSNGKILFWVISCVLSIVIGIFVSLVVWYNLQLSPASSDKESFKTITIADGSTSGQVGKELKEQSIIRSSFAFDVYLRLIGNLGDLKAGTYRLSPSETTPQIISHLVKGSVDQLSITFYPGATLTDNTTNSNKYDITTVLKKAGYSDKEISDAFSAIYTSKLFTDKPINSDLEGYIYGETYNFNAGAKVQDILQISFDEFYKVITDNDLINKFASHGLDLYQGITLASIIQREANSATDQKQVAQVFYSRLDLGMVLGSDVTYQYIADKTGVARDPKLDSPYNTRRFAGLPPGPIASPGLSALLAVADPAAGDYLYFLSGDDDVTYFANSLEEHEANIIDHCKIKCSTP